MGDAGAVTSSGTPPSSTSGQRLGMVATLLAIALIVVYVVFMALQWNNVKAADLEWSRRSDLLGALEALALAAAGALLGTTVQRQVTKKAEDQAAEAAKKADDEKARADANAKDAEKGRALHRLVEVKAGQSGPTAGATRAAPGGPPAGGDLGELLAVAQRYDQG